MRIMGRLRVERRARIHWNVPKRSATSTRPFQRAARLAGSEALSYRTFPKLGELLPFPLGPAKRPTHTERTTYRDNPKRSGVSGTDPVALPSVAPPGGAATSGKPEAMSPVAPDVSGEPESRWAEPFGGASGPVVGQSETPDAASESAIGAPETPVDAPESPGTSEVADTTAHFSGSAAARPAAVRDETLHAS